MTPPDALLDPSTLTPGQAVTLSCPGVGRVTTMFHGSKQTKDGTVFFCFARPDETIGISLKALDDGTLRDAAMNVVEVHHA